MTAGWRRAVSSSLRLTVMAAVLMVIFLSEVDWPVRAQSYSTLHVFNDTLGGQAPLAPPIQAKDGYFYGTTYGGGAFSLNGTEGGTVYRMDSAGNVTILHSFGGSTDGQNPNGLIQGSDGNFYGTTAYGFSSVGVVGYSATLFRMDSAGNVTVMHSFPVDRLGSSYGPMGPLLQAANGSLYGALPGGGSDYGAIFRIRRGRGFDANGDGFSDVLWRNSSSGDVTLWEMNGLNIIQQGYIYHGIPLEWQIAGVGDFNGDGKDDVLWHNSKTGDVIVWLMNGLSTPNQGVVAKGIPLEWQVAGIGDFDGDGKADVLWYNRKTGDLIVWLMNGLTILNQSYIYHGVPLEWQVVAVGDFDGDGKADILWRNRKTGDVSMWLMNGLQLVSSSLIAKAVSLNLHIAGVGDFNGDGKDDILWRDTTSGAVLLWLMNGSQISQKGYVANSVPSQWQIAGIGDFNGDFNSDVLWRNTVTGDVSIWEMNGFNILNQGTIAAGVPLQWRIAAP